MSWQPHVTVACVVERENCFLLVRELANDRKVINQPAGHLDPGETLVDAARRETLEETRWEVTPTAVTGCYQYVGQENGATYLRTCFAADAVREHADLPLDDGILETLWLSLDQVRTLDQQGHMRSPMVLRCIEDYLAGKRYPLELLQHLPAHN